ncbi:MAG TPA: mechanosensitive ion channel family protein, partial [Bacteroidales bacterium]|nr:mechanosensitive ion channel family protein [Bacteroidales bacterium]
MNLSVGLKIKEWLLQLGLSEQHANLLKFAIIIVFILLISYLAYFITNRVILRLIKKLISKTKYTWDDILLQKKVLNRLSHLV